MKAQVLVLFGVSGSGKSTVGELLARRLGWLYADADGFHPAANVAKMAAGHPLSDADRAPWLRSIRAWIDERIARGEPAVATCSALKRVHRDVLRGRIRGSSIGAAARSSEVCMVYLRGTRELIARRLAARKGHFFKRELLDSQFAAFEEPSADEDVVTVSIDATPDVIVEVIIAATGAGRSVGSPSACD
jgi:gluconokinase